MLVRSMLAKSADVRPSVSDCISALAAPDEPDPPQAPVDPTDEYRRMIRGREDVRRAAETWARLAKRETVFCRVRDSLIACWRLDQHELRQEPGITDFCAAGVWSSSEFDNWRELTQQFPDRSFDWGIALRLHAESTLAGVQVVYFLDGSAERVEVTRFVSTFGPTKRIEVATAESWAGSSDEVIVYASQDIDVSERLMRELLLSANLHPYEPLS